MQGMLKQLGATAYWIVGADVPAGTDTTVMGVVLVAGVLAIAVAAYVYRAHWGLNKKIRESVTSGAMIPAGDFLDGWITTKSGHKATGGYKTQDRPGCYVILTDPTEDGACSAVYVGQSMTMCSRVRAHLTGHGNGDVYADVKAGRDVRVRLVPCDPEDMNDTERNLIAAFHATGSYNRTKGGAQRR